MDGYLESKGVFVEAKCHEFYTSHTTIFKKQYKGFYQYLQDKTNGFFKYYVDSNKKTPTVSFSWNNTPITQFDLKQVLCHLLGIAKKTINEKGKQIPTLVYLIYKPSEELLDNVESIDCKQTADAIKRCWGKELEEINTINATGFGLLYNCVVHFLCDEKGIGQELLPGDLERIAKAFQFKLCDQDNYSSTVN